MAKIQEPSDLFAIYDFDDEVKTKIIQFYNADKGIILEINALCLKVKLSKGNNENFTNLHTNYFLAKTPKLRLVFQKDGEKVLFTNISIINQTSN